MKITVLGSSGQIGHYLTEYLKSKGHEVIEYDMVHDANEDATLWPNSILEESIKLSDFVFFLAFDVGGSRYLAKYQHTYQFIDNNMRIMTNVFALLNKYSKPFVFTSSQMSNMNYSSYGTLKAIGEYYTKTLNGLIVKFWNVYGVEHDLSKAHVVTDFIKKGFETGTIDMMTDGVETRQFLYADDCCEALYTILQHYDEFTSADDLHITSFKYNSILDVATYVKQCFSDRGIDVTIVPGTIQDPVQRDAKNEPNPYITSWWQPSTSLSDGIRNIFNVMEENYHVI